MALTMDQLHYTIASDVRTADHVRTKEIVPTRVCLVASIEGRMGSVLSGSLFHGLHMDVAHVSPGLSKPDAEFVKERRALPFAGCSGAEPENVCATALRRFL
jgi:hypothetical protein